MQPTKLFSSFLIASAAVFGIGGANAADLGSLGGLAGGVDPSSLSSGSAGNAAGIVSYCVKNNYLGGDAASSVKDKLMGKIGGDNASASDKADYSDGTNGILKSGDGKKMDLANLGGGSNSSMGGMAGSKMGDMKSSLTKKACASVLDKSKSFL